MVIDSTKFYIACANARANVSEITKRAGCTVSVLHRIKTEKGKHFDRRKISGSFGSAR